MHKLITKLVGGRAQACCFFFGACLLSLLLANRLILAVKLIISLQSWILCSSWLVTFLLWFSHTLRKLCKNPGHIRRLDSSELLVFPVFNLEVLLVTRVHEQLDGLYRWWRSSLSRYRRIQVPLFLAIRWCIELAYLEILFIVISTVFLLLVSLSALALLFAMLFLNDNVQGCFCQVGFRWIAGMSFLWVRLASMLCAAWLRGVALNSCHLDWRLLVADELWVDAVNCSLPFRDDCLQQRLGFFFFSLSFRIRVD